VSLNVASGRQEIGQMAQVFFHYSTPKGVVVLPSVAKRGDLSELRGRAVRVIQTLISAPSLEDWRNWSLHVRDDLGSEILEVPFASLLGQPH
jgi:hypothetical protein